jgi:hypothetical protein
METKQVASLEATAFFIAACQGAYFPHDGTLRELTDDALRDE